MAMTGTIFSRSALPGGYNISLGPVVSTISLPVDFHNRIYNSDECMVAIGAILREKAQWCDEHGIKLAGYTLYTSCQFYTEIIDAIIDYQFSHHKDATMFALKFGGIIRSKDMV
jgi:hypothetical protein